jgi:hypothetical protein
LLDAAEQLLPLFDLDEAMEEGDGVLGHLGVRREAVGVGAGVGVGVGVGVRVKGT